ncbi:MAG: hypothetical protein WDA16_00295 [Candidatus Thermoplasmatota archaeon]
MQRKYALRLLYATSWLAAMELAAEVLLGAIFDPMPPLFRVTARTIQLAALAAGAYALYALSRKPAPAPGGLVDEEAALVHASMILKAHFRDMRDHHNLAGLLILLTAFYAATAYAQSINPVTIPATSLLVGLFSFAALGFAWWHTRGVFRDEEVRLSQDA